MLRMYVLLPAPSFCLGVTPKTMLQCSLLALLFSLTCYLTNTLYSYSCGRRSPQPQPQRRELLSCPPQLATAAAGAVVAVLRCP